MDIFFLYFCPGITIFPEEIFLNPPICLSFVLLCYITGIPKLLGTPGRIKPTITTILGGISHQCSKLRFYFVRHPGAQVPKTCARQFIHAIP